MMPCAFPAGSLFPMLPCAFPARSGFPMALCIGTSAGSCFPMPLASLSEHKIGIFVRFCPPKPSFSGFSSTKSRFLCQKGQFFPGFTPFRAQNRHFCALLPSETPIFGLFEHKIGVFVSERAIFPRFYPLSSTKSGFLCSGGPYRCRRRPRCRQGLLFATS